MDRNIGTRRGPSTREPLEALFGELERIRQECRARAVLLVDTTGRPLAEATGEESLDPDAVASLVASIAAASRALGSRFGVERPDMVIQQGSREVIRLVTDGELVLAVVYGADTPEGLEAIRARLRKKGALRRIRSALQRRDGELLAGLRQEELEGFLDQSLLAEPDGNGHG